MRADGVRFATALALLDSFEDIPVAILDNKTNGLCYANDAFHHLCPEDNLADFLENVERSPSSNNKKPSSLVYQNATVRIAWEESVEGMPVELLPTSKRDSRDNAANSRPDAEVDNAKGSSEDAEGANFLAELDPACILNDQFGFIVYLPLLEEHNDQVLTTDVTPADQGLDPKRSEIDAQLERSVWTALLTEIPAACLILDTKGAVRFASRTLAEVFKLPDNASRWDSVFQLPEGCTGYLEGGEVMRESEYPLWRTVTHKEVIRGLEFRIKRGDGSMGSLRSTSSPVYDKHGDVLGFVAVVEDVTDSYDARQETVELRARHAGVSKANKLKDEFISRISHELRTPINGLLGLQELLTSEPDVSEKVKYIPEVFQLAHRMSAVVDDLLSATLEGGRLELEITPCSLENMVSETMQTLENQARFRGVRTSIRPPVEPDFPRQVLTDRRQLKGIMYRLLDNALKFSHDGDEVFVSIELQSAEEEFWVVIRVLDEGVGIKDATNIWKPFSEESGGISRTSSGLGLGLTYVYHAVRRLGGEIEVAAREPKGSVFSIYFPLALPPSASPPSRCKKLERSSEYLIKAQPSRKTSQQQTDDVLLPPMPEPHREKLSIPAQPARPQLGERAFSTTTTSSSVDERDDTTRQRSTLIVEDDPVNAKILQRTFLKAGFHVQWAQNGKIGFELAQQTLFDLIIMDMMMPVMDGIESTRRIRSWEAENEKKPAHIIGFTANTAARSLDECMEAGMSLVILKPCSGKKLLDAVSPFLRN